MTRSAAEIDHAKLLGIYLNDHHMGASIGVELARRARKANTGTLFAAPLDELVAELTEERALLRSLMDALDIPVNPLKGIAGMVGERVGRLKLNGQLTGYSPLSRVVELEGLHTGANAKLRMWLALQRLADGDARFATIDLDHLIERAESQLDRLEELRLEAAAIAFGSERP
jgi:hypothetical protein